MADSFCTLVTRRGIRLTQHGTVLSEILRNPGPTHSVADVLAAAVHSVSSGPPVALLGFAGGGLVAPLRAMGGGHVILGVDLDESGWGLFRRLCGTWSAPTRFFRADAVVWLRAQRRRFGAIVEDLSVAADGDVQKPDASWSVIPALVAARLESHGLAVFNLLPPARASWGAGLSRIARHFERVAVVHLREYENRILLAGRALPDVRQVSHSLRRSLRGIGSQLAGQISVRSQTLEVSAC